MDGTVETYEAVAERYRERHADREPIADLVARFDAALDGGRVLDVGCGPGWESATLADLGYDVVGVDPTRAFLDIAREEAPAADLARMDMRRLGLRADAFDGVWSLASFLHVPREDAPATLAGFHRVLRPGGVLFLAVKEGEGTERGDSYPGDGREFTLWTVDDLRAAVESQGFAVESRELADESGDGRDWVRLLARA